MWTSEISAFFPKPWAAECVIDEPRWHTTCSLDQERDTGARFCTVATSVTTATRETTRLKPKWIIIGSHILQNWRYRIKTRLGLFDTEHGSTHMSLPIEESVRYIQTVFNEYFRYGGLSPDALRGRRVLEIGPGDNVGVALLFLAAGAREVVCIDKFRAERSEERERAIYLALRESLDDEQRRRFDNAIRIHRDGLQFNTEQLKLVHGTGIEDAPQCFSNQSFDVIISRAVVMEFSDPDRAFAAMDQLLAPGGFMVHKVAPLNDYQVFRQHGYHPLEFLTVSNRLYSLMTASSGLPNRRLAGYYRKCLQLPRYETALQLVQLLGSKDRLAPGTTLLSEKSNEYQQALALAHQIRPRLAADFSEASNEELIIADFFLVARKLANDIRDSHVLCEGNFCNR